MMKKLLLLASIALLVSCSSDDNNNSSSIDVTGNWSFESGEIRSSEASPFIGLTQNDDLECFKMTELRINSNNTVNYSQIYFDVNEQNCLQNPIPFENFTWQFLNGSTLEFNFDYNTENYTYVFEYIVTGTTLELNSESIGNFVWLK